MPKLLYLLTAAGSYNEHFLIREMVNGSQRAFDTLYLQYFDKLVLHVTDITKNSAAAEDIVQDAFFKMWQKRHTFSKYEKISGWLFVTTYNSALNYLRDLLREKQRLITIAQSTQEEEELNLLIHEEQFRLMEEAIEQLPSQRKIVFRLCKLEGLTYDQAAEQLSISRNTVKDHLVKATESIRQHVHNKSAWPLSRYMLLFITCI